MKQNKLFKYALSNLRAQVVQCIAQLWVLNNCSEMVSIRRSGRPGCDVLFFLAIRDPEGRSYRNRDITAK